MKKREIGLNIMFLIVYECQLKGGLTPLCFLDSDDFEVLNPERNQMNIV